MACLLLGEVGCTATVVALSAEQERALYLQRYEMQEKAAQAGGGLPSYDPLETVVGATYARPLPMASNRGIAVEALQAAARYAADRNSSALIVWRDGKIESEDYFAANNRDSLITSKSLAKPVTALLVGRAISEGYIRSLDQPVADFITEWQGDPVRTKILVRHLLDMRSGFLPQGPGHGPDDVLNRAYLHPRHDEIIIREYPLTNPPGTRYEYANANSELVATLIARATGQRYGDYLSKALLMPIGAKGGSIWVNRPGGTAHSGCCLLLPAQSWLRMGILLLHDGVWQGKRLLPKGYVAAMTTATKENPYYGLGVWIAGDYIERRGAANLSIPIGKVLHSAPYAARDLFLFDGNGSQVVYIVPSQKLVVLRTGDRPPANNEWDNSYLPNLLINAIRRKPGESAPEPQRLP